MTIRYASDKLEKSFADYAQLQKKLPADWVRALKKTLDRLRAAPTFGTFLALGLGRPEQLRSGSGETVYSVRISANARLTFSLPGDAVPPAERTELVIQGVCDYHGSKTDWYLP